jgi:hypothetical protein
VDGVLFVGTRSEFVDPGSDAIEGLSHVILGLTARRFRIVDGLVRRLAHVVDRRINACSSLLMAGRTFETVE